MLIYVYWIPSKRRRGSNWTKWDSVAFIWVHVYGHEGEMSEIDDQRARNFMTVCATVYVRASVDVSVDSLSISMEQRIGN